MEKRCTATEKKQHCEFLGKKREKLKKKARARTHKKKEISTHFNDSNVNPTQYQIILDFEHALISFHFDCAVL